ncbi:hypothetical protein BW85_05865, partial [Escherichia coli O69:H11 str. 06-3325]
DVRLVPWKIVRKGRHQVPAPTCLRAKATKGQLSESARTYYKLLILVHPGDARPQPGVNVLQSEDVKLQ